MPLYYLAFGFLNGNAVDWYRQLHFGCLLSFRFAELLRETKLTDALFDHVDPFGLFDIRATEKLFRKRSQSLDTHPFINRDAFIIFFFSPFVLN